MGIKFYQYIGCMFEICVLLNKNINIYGIMFVGSIFFLVILIGWGMIYLQFKECGLDGDIVLGDGDIYYYKFIMMKLRVICNIEILFGKFKLLENDNKVRFELSVVILDGDIFVVEFEGVFYVFFFFKNEEEQCYGLVIIINLYELLLRIKIYL